ncbi:MAG: hypothetical protein ACE5GW_10665 [Planctomycetota bacterium]
MDIQYCDRCGEIIQGASPGGASGGEILCPNCRSGGTGSSPTGRGSADTRGPTEPLPDYNLSSMAEEGNLDLFSSETIAQRRKLTSGRTESRLRLVDEAMSGTESLPADPRGNPSRGSPGPGLSAGGAPDRWRVDCLSCDASLSISPVSGRSKLRCPRCNATMVVDADGRVTLSGGGQPESQQLAHFGTHGDDSFPPPGSTDETQILPLGAAPGQMQGSGVSEAPFSSGAPPIPEELSEILAGGDPGAPEELAPSSDAVAGGLAESPAVGTLTATEEEAPPFEQSSPSAPSPSLAAALLDPPEEKQARRPGAHLELQTRASLWSVGFWMFIAALPSTCALLLVSEAAGEEMQQAVEELGRGIQQNAEHLLDTIRGFWK